MIQKFLPAFVFCALAVLAPYHVEIQVFTHGSWWKSVFFGLLTAACIIYLEVRFAMWTGKNDTMDSSYSIF
jgi:hypothetical protein